MHSFRFVAIFSLFILLTGCKPLPTRLSKYNPDMGKPSAVVVAKIDDVDYINIKRMPLEASELDDNDEYMIKHPLKSPIPYKYTQSVYTIEPGTYYISYAFVSDYNNPNVKVHYTKCDGLNANNEPVYGSFTIAEGQFLYLGDIKVNWLSKNPSDTFCMIDNLQCVKNDLRKAGYKEMSEKIEMAQWQR